MLCAKETAVTFFVMYLSPLMSAVYLLVYLSFKVTCYLYSSAILQWIAFIFGSVA